MNSINPFRYFTYGYKIFINKEYEIDNVRFSAGSTPLMMENPEMFMYNGTGILDDKEKILNLYHFKVLEEVSRVYKYEYIKKLLSEFKKNAENDPNNLTNEEKNEVKLLKRDRDNLKYVIDNELQIIGKLSVRLLKYNCDVYNDCPLNAVYQNDLCKWIIL